MRAVWSAVIVGAVGVSIADPARAQSGPSPDVAVAPVAPAPVVAPDPAPGVVIRTATPVALTLAGYLETYFAWNFGRPTNGVTAYRAFDNRHDTFTLSNAVLDASWALDRVTGRLALQVGSTGAAYYASEPTRPGGAGVNASDAGVWRYVQQANLGYKADVGRGLLFEMGLFLSPIGPEGMPVKDQWNWSRSNLFDALPFYHTGLRASYPLTDTLTATVAAYDGWNSVVDNDEEKSVSASVLYAKPDAVTAQVLYFGGVERDRGAPEGRAFRHLFDAYATVSVTSFLSVLVHADAGFEENHFGTSSWEAAALYARVKLQKWLFVAARGDRLHEHVASSSTGTAAPLFFPSRDVGSLTGTLEVRPQEGLSVRLEARHDQATSDMYFRGTVAGDGTAFPFVPNARTQDTLTLGATAWF